MESESGWAAGLAGVGGFVDAAGFLILLGLFTAHMSGNSTGLGVALATGDWSEALRRGFVIPVFVLATAGGVVWIEGCSGSRAGSELQNRAMAGLLLGEVALLAVVMGLTLRTGFPVSPAGHPGVYFTVAASAALAMGFQNATLRKVQSTGVHTTFVTGMLTELAVSAVRWRLHARRGDRDQALRARAAAGLAGRVWASYVLGAIAGAWLVHRHGAWTLALPMACLVGIAGALWRTPATSARGH
ncbi:MAG: DUF1275 domain-containing protein [Verrucomicrobia bacterium]|nr:DUF1275 domain-containing protein [Verrucomicrobiota bacterium]